MIPLPYPFEREYMQLALLAGVAVAIAAPMVGVFLVQKRLSLLGDGVGHLAFAGVALGVLAGVWPLASALAVAVAGAVAIDRLRSKGRTSGDLALALFFYGGIAAGVVMLGLADSLDARLLGYLFGQVLTVEASEVTAIVVLSAAIAAAVALWGRMLFAVALDEEWARVAGLPVDALNSALAALTAATIVGAMRVVGVLLVAALMVLPVAAAQQMARSFRATLVLAASLGVLSVLIGLAAARVWGLAAGATVVLIAVAEFVVCTAGAALLRRRRPGLGLPLPAAITSGR